MSTSPDARARTSGFRERLRVPARWWLVLALLLASLWLALSVAAPPALLWSVTAATTALGAGLLLGYGGARVEVDAAALRAGRARLEWAYCGASTALDAAAARRLAGVDADPRAFLLLRPYVATAVRVEVVDPADPTPYWLVSTRYPERLAASIEATRVLAD